MGVDGSKLSWSDPYWRSWNAAESKRETEAVQSRAELDAVRALVRAEEREERRRSRNMTRRPVLRLASMSSLRAAAANTSSPGTTPQPSPVDGPSPISAVGLSPRERLEFALESAAILVSNYVDRFKTRTGSMPNVQGLTDTFVLELTERAQGLVTVSFPKAGDSGHPMGREFTLSFVLDLRSYEVLVHTKTCESVEGRETSFEVGPDIFSEAATLKARSETLNAERGPVKRKLSGFLVFGTPETVFIPLERILELPRGNAGADPPRLSTSSCARRSSLVPDTERGEGTSRSTLQVPTPDPPLRMSSDPLPAYHSLPPPRLPASHSTTSLNRYRQSQNAQIAAANRRRSLDVTQVVATMSQDFRGGAIGTPGSIVASAVDTAELVGPPRKKDGGFRKSMSRLFRVRRSPNLPTTGATSALHTQQTASAV